MGFLALVGLAARFAPTAGADVAVGAIRWDAWYGAKDAVGEYVEEALAPEQWRYRLPFFAKEMNSTVRWGYDARQHSSHHACTATSFSLCLYNHPFSLRRFYAHSLKQPMCCHTVESTLAFEVPKGYR
jgi:hypothetical protein